MSSMCDESHKSAWISSVCCRHQSQNWNLQQRLLFTAALIYNFCFKKVKGRPTTVEHRRALVWLKLCFALVFGVLVFTTLICPPCNCGFFATMLHLAHTRRTFVEVVWRQKSAVCPDSTEFVHAVNRSWSTFNTVSTQPSVCICFYYFLLLLYFSQSSSFPPANKNQIGAWLSGNM